MLFGGKASVGLDIGSSYVKVVQLKERKGGYELELFDAVALPPELIVDGSIIDSLRLVEILKELVRKSRIKAKSAVIGIAGHASVIIRRITLPEMSEEELGESIKFEAEQYVPFDVEDVNIDFQILGPTEEPGQMDVMLVAVKKDIINEYTTVVKESGLTPIVVDVNAFALSNMYEANYEIETERNIALVNIGASTINLNVLKGGVSVFTRDSSVGSNLLTEALQKEFNLTYEDAEKLKRGEATSDVKPEVARPVMISAFDDILSEIARSIEYYKTTTVQEDVHEVVLSGGGALMLDFPRLLAERIMVEVKVAEPFRNIVVPKRFDITYLEEMAPMAAVAVGLAMRRQGDR